MFKRVHNHRSDFAGPTCIYMQSACTMQTNDDIFVGQRAQTNITEKIFVQYGRLSSLSCFVGAHCTYRSDMQCCAYVHVSFDDVDRKQRLQVINGAVKNRARCYYYYQYCGIVLYIFCLLFISSSYDESDRERERKGGREREREHNKMKVFSSVTAVTPHCSYSTNEACPILRTPFETANAARLRAAWVIHRTSHLASCKRDYVT